MAGVKGKSGRPLGYHHDADTREKIRTGVLIDILEKIADGRIKKPNPVRVTAALGLLKKTLPDLTATDITSGNKPIVMERKVFKRPPVDSVANGKQEKETSSEG